MSIVDDLYSKIKNSKNNCNLSDVVKLCTYHFGDYKPGKGGHIIIFDIPGAPPGECKLSFQPDKKKKGQAKTYQVEQALKAIDKYGRRDE